jgi:hypothetical protein
MFENVIKVAVYGNLMDYRKTEGTQNVGHVGINSKIYKHYGSFSAIVGNCPRFVFLLFFYKPLNGRKRQLL